MNSKWAQHTCVSFRSGLGNLLKNHVFDQMFTRFDPIPKWPLLRVFATFSERQNVSLRAQNLPKHAACGPLGLFYLWASTPAGGGVPATGKGHRLVDSDEAAVGVTTLPCAGCGLEWAVAPQLSPQTENIAEPGHVCPGQKESKQGQTCPPVQAGQQQESGTAPSE